MSQKTLLIDIRHLIIINLYRIVELRKIRIFLNYHAITKNYYIINYIVEILYKLNKNYISIIK